MGWALYVKTARFSSHQRVQKTFRCPGYVRVENWVVWIRHSLLNLYIWPTISSSYGSIPLTLGFIGRHGSLSTLSHSCRFPCQQRMLIPFPGPGYLHFKDRVVWLCHSLVNFHIWVTISSCYDSSSLTFRLIRRKICLSVLSHSCAFTCQQRVLKTLTGPGFLRCNDEVVWLWHSLVNLYIRLTISSCYSSILWP